MSQFIRKSVVRKPSRRKWLTGKGFMSSLTRRDVHFLEMPHCGHESMGICLRGHGLHYESLEMRMECAGEEEVAPETRAMLGEAL